MQRKLSVSVFNLGIAFSLALLSAACGGGGGGGSDGGGNPSNPEAPKVHYFQGDNDGDVELWRTDGTEVGTYRVKDIHPTDSSWPNDFFTVGGRTYFMADDGVHGFDLWITDGTEAGTHLVTDMYPGNDGNLWLCSFTAFRGKAYFTPCMTPDGEPGGLWETNGTAAGTRRIADTIALVDEMTVVGDLLVFSGKATDATQTELWAYDGINPPAPVLDSDGESQLNPGSFVVSGGSVYFSASSTTAGKELRRFDTDEILGWDVCPGVCGSARPLGAGNHRVYFQADQEGYAGRELWVLDPALGTTTRLHEFTSSLSALFIPIGMVGGRMVFLGREDSGIQLWTTDGTEAGTIALTEVSGGFGQVLSSGVVGNAAVAVLQGESGVEVWRTDGTAAGTAKVAAVADTTCINPEVGFAAAGGVYFGLQQDEDTKVHLWRTDGTEAGTHRIAAAQLSTCSF